MPSVDPQTALAQLKGTARELVALLGTASASQVARRPDGGGWSPATVVAHLADVELVYGYRIRMVVAGDRPYLAAFDQDVWVERFSEIETDVRESLARWRSAREANLRILASLDDDEWKLSGLHAERGEVTVAQIAALLAAHDAAHVDQIRTGLA